ELSSEQAFCSLKSLTSSDPSSSCRPTKVEVPNELPKVSMVNTSLKKLKRHLADFDVVVKQRTTPTAIIEGTWEFEHTKACFRDQIIPFVKALKDLFNTFDKYLIDELSEVQNVFHQMEQAVEQHRFEAKSFEIQQRKILTENDQLLDQVLFHDIMNVVVNNSVNVNSFVAMKDYMNMSDMFVEKCQKCLELETELVKKDKNNPEIHDFFETNDLKAQLQEKDTTINKLKENVKDLRKNPDRVKKEYDAVETINIELEHSVAKLLSENENLSKEIILVIEALENELKRIKGKHVVDSVTPKPKAITIALGMFRVVVEPLPPKFFKNKEAHIDYIHKSRENANVHRELLEEVRASNPLDSELDLASAVTPKNKHKKVSFAKAIASSSNSHKQVESPKTSDYNKHVLLSTGLKSSTKVCRSQPSGNKRNDRIPQPQRSNFQIKVEAQHRNVTLSANNMNHVKTSICDANIKRTMLNANSELMCVKCNQCMFDANHDACFLKYVSDMNVRSKSKSE
ncbi:hypothetical protein Tco_1355925, partial [Tanacetum coccineum]